MSIAMLASSESVFVCMVVFVCMIVFVAQQQQQLFTTSIRFVATKDARAGFVVAGDRRTAAAVVVGAGCHRCSSNLVVAVAKRIGYCSAAAASWVAACSGSTERRHLERWIPEPAVGPVAGPAPVVGPLVGPEMPVVGDCAATREQSNLVSPWVRVPQWSSGWLRGVPPTRESERLFAVVVPVVGIVAAAELVASASAAGNWCFVQCYC